MSPLKRVTAGFFSLRILLSWQASLAGTVCTYSVILLGRANARTSVPASEANFSIRRLPLYFYYSNRVDGPLAVLSTTLVSDPRQALLPGKARIRDRKKFRIQNGLFGVVIQ